jgi:hypothetical protein
MNPRIEEVNEEPEDADLWGWSGPGWYWIGVTDMTGPFATQEDALADWQSYEDFLAAQYAADGDVPWDGSSDEGYDPEDDR